MATKKTLKKAPEAARSPARVAADELIKELLNEDPGLRDRVHGQAELDADETHIGAAIEVFRQRLRK